MALARRIVLDVLKPHRPNAFEFAKIIAELSPDYRVKLTVTEIDKKTESTLLVIEGDDVDYNLVMDTIGSLGASVHSIDEVEVVGFGS